MKGPEKLYCQNCKKMVEYRTVKKTLIFQIRGERVEVISDQPVCIECGEEIDSEHFRKKAEREAKRKYSLEKGLVLPEKIKEIRKKYGMSQDLLARILGIGKATVARYELGEIPSRVFSDLIKEIEDPKYFSKIVERAKERISKEEYRKLRRRISELETARSDLEEELQKRAGKKLNFEKIYGAFCWALKKRGGEASVEELIDIAKKVNEVFEILPEFPKGIFLLFEILESEKIISIEKDGNGIRATLRDSTVDLFLEEEDLRALSEVFGREGV